MKSSTIILFSPSFIGRIAPVLGAVIFFAATFASLTLPAYAETDTKTYYSDLLKGAVHDPAFADVQYKTRRDVLPGVVGPETWVEHFVRDGVIIETLTYNDLTYGIIVKDKNGKSEYWALGDDRRSYERTGGQSPEGWTIANPPSYSQIVDKIKKLLAAKRYDDIITEITKVMGDSGIETADLYFYRGFSYDQLGELSYAKSDYKKAISIDSTNADAYYNLGMIYRNEGDAGQAVPLFERYLVLYPSDPQAEAIRNYINSNKQ